jgi:alpha-tubulin suppressor-like RCC1 family protein
MERIIQPLPVRHDLGGKAARSVDQTWFSLCAVTTDDTLFCWGRGIEGQLGQGGIAPSNVPRETARGIRSVGVGWFFTCAERLDGRVACTGENNRGQLGLGDQNRRATLTDQ